MDAKFDSFGNLEGLQFMSHLAGTSLAGLAIVQDQPLQSKPCDKACTKPSNTPEYRRFQGHIFIFNTGITSNVF